MARCALPRSPPWPREFPGAARAAGTPHRHTASLSHCERGTLILTVRLLHLPLVVAAGQRNTRPDSPAHVASNLHPMLNVYICYASRWTQTFPVESGRHATASIQERRRGMPRDSRLYRPRFALVLREANPAELKKETSRGATGR